MITHRQKQEKMYFLQISKTLNVLDGLNTDVSVSKLKSKNKTPININL